MSKFLHPMNISALLTVAMSAGNAQTWDLGALRTFASLTPAQWRAVERGEVQARTLDTQDKREVAVVGVARLRATTACFLARFQEIETFKKNPAVLKIRKFRRAVDPQDVADFTLQSRDLTDLPNCIVGNCNVKLSAAMIERLASDVDWSRPGHLMAQAVMRDELLSYLRNYVQQGNAALIEYRDKAKPVRLAHEFQGVLDAPPGLAGFVPQFHNYLAESPTELPQGVSEFFYWSLENFGLKPVASVTHVSLYVQPGEVVTASKQVYASHYFDASLGIAAALDDQSDPSQTRMHLVYLNRSRIDLLSGFFGGLRRAILRGRLRDGMRKNLTEVIGKLESSCAETPAADATTP